MAERIALGMRPDLDGRDCEYQRLAVAIGVAEGAIASGELPPAVQPVVPSVAAGGQHDVRVGPQVANC